MFYNFFHFCSIKPERSNQLAELIVEAFPSEDKTSYYIPYKYDSVTKKKCCAKGKLHDKHHAFRALMLGSKLTEKQKNSLSKRKHDDSRLAVLGFRNDLQASNGT